MPRIHSGRLLFCGCLDDDTAPINYVYLFLTSPQYFPELSPSLGIEQTYVFHDCPQTSNIIHCRINDYLMYVYLSFPGFRSLSYKRLVPAASIVSKTACNGDARNLFVGKRHHIAAKLYNFTSYNIRMCVVLILIKKTPSAGTV